jgi:hypothetical protein
MAEHLLSPAIITGDRAPDTLEEYVEEYDSGHYTGPPATAEELKDVEKIIDLELEALLAQACSSQQNCEKDRGALTMARTLVKETFCRGAILNEDDDPDADHRTSLMISNLAYTIRQAILENIATESRKAVALVKGQLALKVRASAQSEINDWKADYLEEKYGYSDDDY